MQTRLCTKSLSRTSSALRALRHLRVSVLEKALTAEHAEVTQRAAEQTSPHFLCKAMQTLQRTSLMTLAVLLVLICASVFSVDAQSTKSSPRLRPIQQNGKWGYIDSSGKIVIKRQFVWAEEFSEGLAAFENEDGKHGYIDETGTVVIEPKFDNWTNFSEGLAAVSVDFQWGYIDRTGKWAIPPQFVVGRPFSNGLARVEVPLNGKASFPPGRAKHAFIDKTGKIVIDSTDDILNGTFSEDVGTVQFVTNKGANAVLIDKTGKTIVAVDDVDTDGFSEGLVPAKKNKKWGYLDTKGQFVIEPQFEKAFPFSEGLAAVSVGEKWGFIDHTGRLVIKPKYSIGWDHRHHAFSEGLALVYLRDQCAYIDKFEKVVIRVNCSDAEQFSGGIASVITGAEKHEKRGYINKQGRYVFGPVAFKYKTMEEVSARAEKNAKVEEVLTPLTPEERALDARKVIANQPDFVADLSYFVGEGFGGYGFAQKLARKGNRYREESEFWIFVGELGKPSARLFPEAKMYDDFEPPRGGSADSTPINPAALAQEDGVSFSALGTRVIDGHNCLKIEATRTGKPEKFYFYAALDLQNLVILVQILEPRRNTVQRLGNISFEVPDELVQIPADYKAIKHDRWVKLENAQVKYGRKLAKDFVVFRAPGGQLFVRVNDWSYLVRPKEATVETVFQGLIVTRAGEFIWQTKETEGFSAIQYQNPRPPSEWEKSEGRRVIVTPNSVTFRATDYDKTKAMIEVRW
jgi:WG repeat protein